MADEWMTAEIDIKPVYTAGEWTDDLGERATYWLNKALGRAQSVAPCLRENPGGLPPYVQESAKGIIVNAVLRLIEDSKGGTQYQFAGPFGVNTDTKLRSDRILTIADRDELKQLCRQARGRRQGGTIRTRIGY